MKKIMIFYQEKCPFCKRAFNYIEELKKENSKYSEIPIELIEETLQPDFADTFDYYYVPTFYVDGEKVHEGGIKKDEVKAIFNAAIE
ncbi:MAG: thioredoxin family protein [Bacteroidaceae bacterium]|nr:thioredoxin family protein [Bacteroidaceae bacterium]